MWWLMLLLLFMLLLLNTNWTQPQRWMIIEHVRRKNFKSLFSSHTSTMSVFVETIVAHNKNLSLSSHLNFINRPRTCRQPLLHHNNAVITPGPTIEAAEGRWREIPHGAARAG